MTTRGDLSLKPLPVPASSCERGDGRRPVEAEIMSRILIADDDPVVCRLLSGLLTKWGYEVEVTHNGVDARFELLRHDAPQLAILDWMMPGLDGTQVIRQLRASRRAQYTYVILLTARGQKEDLLEGLSAGADDFLKKPFDAQELRARLHVGRRVLDLERRLLSALETAEHRATHDFLSGIFNRVAIVELLVREASRCARDRQPMSVLMVDIDHFKSVNDTWGHFAGDQVIRQLAERMARFLRPYDSIGRFGGEEFLVLTPNCGPGEAMEVAERVRLGIAMDPMAAGPHSIQVTASIGVSTVTEAFPDVNLALRAADCAMYEAKRKGRNRSEYCVVPESSCVPSPQGEDAAVNFPEEECRSSGAGSHRSPGAPDRGFPRADIRIEDREDRQG
jgi:diguanylate cyclase (GGDEF)-like protein